MNRMSRALIAIAFLSANVLLARSSLNEDAALNVLIKTIKHDHIYDKRISLDCVTFDTEETTRIYFQVALREKHDKKCGGDPDTSPVIDRYRVGKASGRIEWYNPTEDNYEPYNPAKIR